MAVAEFVAELSPAHTPRSDLHVVYTAMHGVGAATFIKLLEATGFNAPQLVTSQSEPDPAFPTVAFPNPENPGRWMKHLPQRAGSAG